MKPDFTGEWILNRQMSTLSSAAAPIESGVMSIDPRDRFGLVAVIHNVAGAVAEPSFGICNEA
jgi:hypothetical protein